MMEKRKRVEVVLNVLVLTLLVGAMLLSWMIGHTLRYSIPGLWHPPIQEMDPQIKIGIESESQGIRRQVGFTGITQASYIQVKVFIPDFPLQPLTECRGYSTYFTSLPAKCQTTDG